MPILEYKRNGKTQNDLELHNNRSSASIDDNTTSTDKTWSSKKIDTHLNNIANKIGKNEDDSFKTLETDDKTIIGAINEVFQNVSNGKELVANAITDKGVDTLATDTFAQMAINISQITTGTVDGLVVTIDNIRYRLSADSQGNTIATKVKHTITNNLTNVTNSNTTTEVEDNTSYSANITLQSNYKLDTIVVTMGGVDITSACYSNGTINIESVIGNIVITASASEITVVGSVDSSNNIELTGLSTGTYTLKYEDDTGILSNYDDIATMEVV